MRHVAAYLLCVLGGNATPSAADVTSVITACGGEVDEEQLGHLMEELEGKDIGELVAKGKEQLKNSRSAAGAAVVAVVGGAAPAAAAPAAAAAPVAKVEEVDALEGGMDMFGGGGSDY